MSVSPSASETLLLLDIWLVSLLLALVSLSVLLWLILSRLHSQRKYLHLAERRKTLYSLFHTALQLPAPPTPDLLPKLGKSDYGIICSIALDMLRNLRGGERQRIVDLLKSWDTLPYLLHLLKQGRRGKRIQALSLIARFDTPEAEEILLKHIRHPDTYTQLAALRGLAARGDIRHLDQAVEALAQSNQRNTLMLADILSRFGDAAAPFLIELAGSDALPEVRSAAIMTLGNMRALAAVDSLIRLCHDAHPEIRAAAVAALGEMGDSRAGDAAVLLLRDEAAPVREQAAHALGLLVFQPALPALAACLSDTAWWVRFRAAEALHRLGDRGLAMLRSVSVQPDEAGRIARDVLAEKEVA